MILNLPAAELTDEEWATIEAAFASGSKFRDVLAKLRATNNTPTKAVDLFDAKLVNQGHCNFSMPLRDAKLAFRLSRIGELQKGARGDRLLAIVRLPEEVQQELSRRSYNKGPRHYNKGPSYYSR